MMMAGKSSAILGGNLRNLSISCYLPPTCIDAETEPGTLDAQSLENFHNVLKCHDGDLQALLAMQVPWRSLASARARVEPTKTISEMISAAAASQKNNVADRQCITINCQSTRDNGFGYATVTRLLKDTGAKGQGHTISHCGTTNAYMALEQAIVLGCIEPASKILISAGDRWLDTNPRYLGRWVTFSDGAAVASADVKQSKRENCWVLNTNLSSCNLSEVTRTGCCPRHIASEVATSLLGIMSHFSDCHAAEILVLSPAVGEGFVVFVEKELSRRSSVSLRIQPSSGGHIGSADPLLRLARFSTMTSQSENGSRQRAALVWDYEPQGLLGAALVLQEAFQTPHMELAA